MGGKGTAWLNGLGQKIALAGVLQESAKQSSVWNFVSGVTSAWNEAEQRWDFTFSGGGSSGHTIQNQGVSLTQRSTLNFVGINVVASDVAGVTTVTVGAVSLAGSQVTGTLPYTRGGTGLGTLGTAGQSYRVNAGATAVEWYTPAAGLNAPANPADDGKVAVASAANLSYILIGNPQIAAAAAIALSKLAAQAALSVVANATNGSAVPTAVTAGGADLVFCVNAAGTALGFTTITTGGIGNSQVTYAKIQNVSAQGKILMRKSASAGVVEEGVAHDGVETDATGFKLSDTVPARGTLNTAVDVVPTLQVTQTVNTGSSQNHDFALAAGKRYIITVDIEVVDGSHGWLYTKRLSVSARNNGGTCEITSTTVIAEAFNTGVTGFTLTAAISTTNLRFTIANTNGTNRVYNVMGGSLSLDRP